MHVYQINPGARWYYEWESAATKAQRFTRHVLRVYVFERVQASDRLDPRALRVVAVATSTEFLVVSYRRAPTEGRTERRDAQPLSSIEWGPNGVDDSSTTSSARHSSRRSSHIADVVERDAALDGLHADQKAWEALHEDVMLTSKHFAVLYHFIMSIDALPFHSCLTHWSALLYEQLEGEHSPRKLESVWASDEGVQDPVARVVHVCARIVGWLLFDRETMGQLRRLLADCAHGLLDKRALRSGYLAAMEFLRDRVDQFAESSSLPQSSSTPSSSTLALVTEEILAVVFQTEAFKSLRPVFIGVLAAPTMHGFQTYVAQVRAMFITTAVPHLTRAAVQPPSIRSGSPFEGTWDLDGNRSAVKSAARTTAGFSLGCAMHFLREWAQVSIRVTSEHSIAVSSSWASAVGADPDRALAVAMHLTLDGRRRVFRNFPSGLSSMIIMGSQMLGEYRGQVESASSFWVEFSSADSADNSDGFRWVLQFLADDFDETRGAGSSMVVEGSIEQIGRHGEEAPPQSRSEQFQLNLAFNRCSA